MRFATTIFLSVGVLIFVGSCQRQAQSKRPNPTEELKRLDEFNARARDGAMQGTVPEPKPAKDVIFH